MQKKGTPKKEVQKFKDTCGVTKPEKEYIVNINFGEPNNLSIPILTIDDVSFSYDGKKDILKNVNFGMDLDSRITIVGPNGAGKSTFINLVVGNNKPNNGSVFRNNNLKLHITINTLLIFCLWIKPQSNIFKLLIIYLNKK